MIKCVSLITVSVAEPYKLLELAAKFQRRLYCSRLRAARTRSRTVVECWLSCQMLSTFGHFIDWLRLDGLINRLDLSIRLSLVWTIDSTQMWIDRPTQSISESSSKRRCWDAQWRQWTPYAQFAIDSPRILGKSAANPRHSDMFRRRRFAADS